MKKNKIIFTLFVILFVGFVQAAPPPTGKPNPGCWPPPCIPVDGGITLFAATAALLGIKKIYSSTKK